MIKTNN